MDIILGKLNKTEVYELGFRLLKIRPDKKDQLCNFNNNTITPQNKVKKEEKPIVASSV